MTLLRCCLFAVYIALAAGAWAETTTPQLANEPIGVKARLSLLSQISSRSPSGSSFMAKVEDPVEVQGKAVLPAGTLVKDIWKQRQRGVRCGEAHFA
jgi:hypothetical protein